MYLGEKLLKELGLSKIKPDDVTLRPIMQKEENNLDNNLKNLVRKHLSKNKWTVNKLRLFLQKLLLVLQMLQLVLQNPVFMRFL